MMGDDTRLRRRCVEHGYFVESGGRCPEAPQLFWGGTPCEIYDPIDEITAAVEERRRDPVFMARLARIMEENRSVLDALAPHDGGRA